VQAGTVQAGTVRMLVTGGAGFIGANYVRQTVAARPDIAVTVVDSLSYAASLASLEPVRDRITFVAGSIADERLARRLVSEADIVVNFAAETHNDNALADPRPFLESNVVGTWNLLEAVRACGARLHHVSTDEVFGDLALDDPSRFTAESPYRPSSPYSATKASADLLVRAWARSFGISATISVCCNNYGPLQHVEKFIPRQITSILLGARPKVYGTGANVRDWIHVLDHVSALQAIIDRGRPGRTYLIGAGCEASNLTVARTLLRLMGKPEDWIEFTPDRPGHDVRYAVSPDETMAELGWRPRYTDLEAGLAETIGWYAANRGWWQEARARAEARYARLGR
jgi:dTDP-glucose 4,6-dehydratase